MSPNKPVALFALARLSVGNNEETLVHVDIAIVAIVDFNIYGILSVLEFSACEALTSLALVQSGNPPEPLSPSDFWVRNFGHSGYEQESHIPLTDNCHGIYTAHPMSLSFIAGRHDRVSLGLLRFSK